MRGSLPKAHYAGYTRYVDEGIVEWQVLIVEDDPEIAELVAAYLGREGFGVATARSAEDARRACAERTPDLVLLDLGLPGADGLDFLRRFRETSIAPVIIVSARESDEDKVAGLGLGADDFVSKPFSPKVLAARVAAQLRRASYPPAMYGSQPKRIVFGSYSIDFDSRTLESGGERVALSRREFELLSFLIRNAGKAFRPDELYAEVWGLEHGDLSTVAVHVQRVRRKIEDNPSKPRWIKTVPGAGYRFFLDEGRP